MFGQSFHFVVAGHFLLLLLLPLCHVLIMSKQEQAVSPLAAFLVIWVADVTSHSFLFLFVSAKFCLVGVACTHMVSIVVGRLAGGWAGWLVGVLLDSFIFGCLLDSYSQSIILLPIQPPLIFGVKRT